MSQYRIHSIIQWIVERFNIDSIFRPFAHHASPVQQHLEKPVWRRCIFWKFKGQANYGKRLECALSISLIVAWIFVLQVVITMSVVTDAAIQESYWSHWLMKDLSNCLRIENTRFPCLGTVVFVFRVRWQTSTLQENALRCKV